ncbi:MAG: hypothetical protein ACI9OJ_004647, partial [Myxococcota bacterium]
YNVVHNGNIRDLGNIGSMFVRSWGTNSGDYHAEINAAYWRPLVSASFALNRAVSPEPFGFHLTNNLLHAANSALVALIIMTLVGVGRPGLLAGAIGGLWFALHPVHTETVNLISYRTELLAVLPALAMIAIHTREGRTWKRDFLFIPLLYAIGLMSKETAITAPGWLFLLDMARGRTKPRELWRTYGPLTLVLAGYFVVRSLLLSPSAITFFGNLETGTVVMSVMKIVATDFRLLIAPWPLIPFYDWTVLSPALSPDDPVAISGILLLGLSALIAVRSWRINRGISIGICWILLGLLPFLQIIALPVGAAERFLYFASVGGALLAGIGGAWAFERWPRVATLSTGAILVVFAALTFARNADWKNDRTILEAAVRDFPHSYNAQHSLGMLHGRADRRDLAESYFQAAESILPAMEPNVIARANNFVADDKYEEARAVVSAAIARRGPLPSLVAAAKALR